MWESSRLLCPAVCVVGGINCLASYLVLLQPLPHGLLCHDSIPQTEGQSDTPHCKQQDRPYQRNSKAGRTMLHNSTVSTYMSAAYL